MALGELGTTNRNGWLKAATAVAVSVAVNILSSWLAARLGPG